MFNARYFATRYFPQRYFPKVGEDPTGDFQPAWAGRATVNVSWGLMP